MMTELVQTAVPQLQPLLAFAVWLGLVASTVDPELRSVALLFSSERPSELPPIPQRSGGARLALRLRSPCCGGLFASVVTRTGHTSGLAGGGDGADRDKRLVQAVPLRGTLLSSSSPGKPCSAFGSRTPSYIPAPRMRTQGNGRKSEEASVPEERRLVSFLCPLETQPFFFPLGRWLVPHRISGAPCDAQLISGAQWFAE
ncbi:hypothetical protein HJG60_011795 [Phyllostomus discolor]|uniref:Uncharacterized protein n=1 Tax=Phyllostomus discolor TaxID=89673 RepID=A0A833ZNM6_9CHIR|nr:hypothetical protein HJG60_011795 [Phyllostomus discolor]